MARQSIRFTHPIHGGLSTRGLLQSTTALSVTATIHVPPITASGSTSPSSSSSHETQPSLHLYKGERELHLLLCPSNAAYYYYTYNAAFFCQSFKSEVTGRAESLRPFMCSIFLSSHSVIGVSSPAQADGFGSPESRGSMSSGAGSLTSSSASASVCSRSW
jgi:hypothetical protein